MASSSDFQLMAPTRRKMKIKVKNSIGNSFSLIIVFLFLFSCHSSPRTKLLRTLDATPAKNLQSYEYDRTSTVISRVTSAPAFILSFWNKTDKTTDYSSYAPTQDELRMIGDYLQKLPRHYQEVLQQRLVAIYFVNNLRGSGATDYILDAQGDIYTIMLFNPNTLRTDLSKWLTYRENSCFIRNAADVKIDINCGTKYTGFLYALVHESTHVVDYVESYTPYIEKNIAIIKEVKATSTPFTKNIWKDLAVPLLFYDFPNRKNVTFYGDGGPNINISDARELYEHLMVTPFVSLYGSMNWAEDFADSMTFYHITHVLGQPYEIRYAKNGDLVRAFRPMESTKVKERFSLLRELY
jgi:hypothetical protein